jgi:non-ribosomal peptide synthetase component E (peptide arylation enzyme)
MLDRTMEQRPWHAHYDQGVERHIDYADVPVSEIVARTAKRFPDRPALAFLNASFTYAELDDKVSRCAQALQRLGVK